MNTDQIYGECKILISVFCLIVTRAVQEYEPDSSGNVVTSDI